MNLRLFFLPLLGCLVASCSAYKLPEQTTQCVVGVADDWNSSKATLALYEKKDGQWQQVGRSCPTRLGRNGLAWGLGQHPVPAGAPLKREGDWKAPAGVFELGGAWGYDATISKDPDLPYTQITSRHLWVEDPDSKHYNCPLILDREPAAEWEKQAQMRQDDPAHALKLFIAHNAPPKVAKGMGSSIFFHIWREDGARPTAGCTVMSEERLRWLISRIDPDKKPVYVLLPKKEYEAYRAEWGLP
ncbi:MAG: L,D-transpeptidase family protein [Akkermansiaceae bacterium]|nr:L,D-transpeptidase family protein [Akkermansiaceae bacterium]